MVTPVSTRETVPGRTSIGSWTGWAAFGVPFLVAGIVYWLTSAAALTWKLAGDDGGDLSTAVALDGVPHPTGYPLYLITGKLLSFLAPDPARALTITTALWGALAAGILSLTVYRFGRKLLLTSQTFSPKEGPLAIANLAGGWLAGLSLAFAPLAWSQAVIVEIYSLNLLLLSGLLLALVWWWERPASQPRFYVLAVMAGLALGHHRTAVFSLLAVAIFVFLINRTTTTEKNQESAKSRKIHEEAAGFPTWPRIIIGLVLAGLVTGLPSLLILSRGGQNPASNWDNLSWSDPAGFFQYLTGGEYRNLLFAAPIGQDFGRIAATAGLLFQQFGIVGLVLGWVGLAVLWLGQPEFRPAAWLVTVGLVGHLLFAAIYAADNSQIYLLPFFSFWIVAAGLGLSWLILTGVARWPNYRRLVGLVPLMVIILAGTGIATNYGKLDLSHDRSAEAWARAQLETAPAKSVFVTSQDGATFAMWYVQYVQHYRPEIIVVESRLLGTEWYRVNLARLYPNLKLPASGQLNELIAANPELNVSHLLVPSNQSKLP